MTKAEPTPRLRISKSAIETWNRCPRLWHYQKVLDLEPLEPPSQPQAIGNVVHHAGLEGFFKAGLDLDGMLDMAAKHPDFPHLEQDNVYKVQAMLTAWSVVFRSLRSQIRELLYCEDRLYRHVGPDRYTSVCDLVYRDRRGIWVLDLKTTSRYINARYWQSVERDLQVGYYLTEVEELLGEKPQGLVWQVAKVPKREVWDPKERTIKEHIQWLSDKMIKRTDVWFPYREITLTPHELNEARTDITATVDAMATAKAKGLPPRNRKACYDYNRLCEFNPVCFEGKDPNDERLYRIRHRPNRPEGT